jgi:hypothetical protein
MNSYIKPNFATAEAAAADVASAADVSVTTMAAYSTSGVNIADDAEGDITVKAVESGREEISCSRSFSPRCSFCRGGCSVHGVCSFRCGCSFFSGSSYTGCCFYWKEGANGLLLSFA